MGIGFPVAEAEEWAAKGGPQNQWRLKRGTPECPDLWGGNRSTKMAALSAADFCKYYKQIATLDHHSTGG